MSLLSEAALVCPYCGEPITILVDGSVAEQQYIEDCEVCCRPMEVSVRVAADGAVSVQARHEDQG
ncbi:MAG TPA: CPXCG motif-containing cysteine-rich protein [Xanthomonadales bacterium]|nr:CPXCG motif-containing cysteine-rich protein [Xanthomonadales bacterium]